MIPLMIRLEQYLELRRSFGHKLITEERVLHRFVEFAGEEQSDHLSGDLFLRWKSVFGSASNSTWAHRLGMVRGFAEWLKAVDFRTEVPSPGLVVGKHCRVRPYIYTEKEISAILEEAAHLPSSYGIRSKTCVTLFGLLSVTGMLHQKVPTGI